MALGSLNSYFILFIRNQVCCVSHWRDSPQNREGKSKRNELMNLLSAEMPHVTEPFPFVFPLGKSTTNWSQFSRCGGILINSVASIEMCDSWALSGHQSQGQNLSLPCAGGTISAHWAMQLFRSNQGNGVMVTAWSQPQGQQIQSPAKALLRQILNPDSQIQNTQINTHSQQCMVTEGLCKESICPFLGGNSGKLCQKWNGDRFEVSWEPGVWEIQAQNVFKTLCMEVQTGKWIQALIWDFRKGF